jgi:hypothetical protein
MALMGAHGIMMTQGCTTNGEQPGNGTAIPDMADRTCGGRPGRQRMFTWDNSFFQVPPIRMQIPGFVSSDMFVK